MAIVTTNSSHYSDIADAIRAKGGSGSYTPAQMADAIGSIQTGSTPQGSISITSNGTYDVTQYAEAIVNVIGSGGISGTQVTITSACTTPADIITALYGSTSPTLLPYKVYVAIKSDLSKRSADECGIVAFVTNASGTIENNVVFWRIYGSWHWNPVSFARTSTNSVGNIAANSVFTIYTIPN